MPFHRSERSFSRAGLPIARSTLCTLFHRTAELLVPIYEQLKQQARASRYVHADETGLKLQSEGKCRDGWMDGWMGTMLLSEAVGCHFSEHLRRRQERSLPLLQ
jgi:hypothetical protein